jgi:MFS transporter, DHA2 family, multidrug resistance protein
MKPAPFTGFSLVLLTLALGLGTFIQVLDSSVANVAVAYIAGDLAVSTSQGTWVITSFSISNGIVLALTGWLASRFGSIRLFVWSTALFSLTSWLCGFSWNLASLIFFRILQGASAGALIPLSQSLLILHYPPERKGIALGFWSMIVIVAPILGPVVGGYLTDNYGWRWIFYINIPFGLLSAWMTWILLKDEEDLTVKQPIDMTGVILLTIGVSCLQVFLDKGNELDWLDSNFIRLFLAGSIIAFMLFIPWNYYSDFPVMNFEHFKKRNFLIGTLLGAFGFMMIFGSTVLIPLWLISDMGYNAFVSGLAVMPIGILPLILSPILGRYLYLFDLRWLATACFITFFVTFLWLSGLTSMVSLQRIMEYRFVQGIGLGLFFIPIISLALSPIANHELAAASGTFNFIRLIAGGGIGTALYVTLWDRRTIYYHSRLSESITIFDPETFQFYQTIHDQLHVATAVINQIMEDLLVAQASLLAMNDIFWLTGWFFLILVPLIWFSRPEELVAGKAVVVSE